MIREAAVVVFVKELREGLRDRRSIAAAVAATLAGPLVVGIVVAMLVSDSADSGPMEVPVVGAERAPGVMRSLAAERIVIVSPPADIEAEVRAGRLDVGLVIPDDYPARYGAVRTAPVRVVSDPTRGASRDAARRLREALARCGRQIATVRLIARGINPEVVVPLRVEDVDVSTERARAAVALSVLPVFLLVSTFVMGMSVAIDTTAGERERRSLEPLLLTGAPPLAIGAGKWAATAVLNVAGLVLTLACATLILTRVPLEDLGVRLDSVGALSVGVLVVGVPLALLAAALEVAAATRARTFKEGQTYLSMLLFLPMFVGMFSAFSHARPAAWRLAVPVLGQQQLLAAVLRGEAPGLLALALPALVALVITALLLDRIARLLSSDRTLYG
jgi:sodium transport system permease protein